MSTELVPIDASIVAADDRHRALAELNHAAEHASTPEEAREVMVKARTISDLLLQMNEPFDQARAAGKASVVAAHRLGRLLSELSSQVRYTPGQRGGLPSERGLAIRALGLHRHTCMNLMRLARSDRPSFQRYIQRQDVIPSLNGAVLFCVPSAARKEGASSGSWRLKRIKQVGVKQPINPSLDEGYSLIVRAIGHLSGSITGKGTAERKRDVGMVIDQLYAAEELLKPYRGGYVK